MPSIAPGRCRNRRCVTTRTASSLVLNRGREISFETCWARNLSVATFRCAVKAKDFVLRMPETLGKGRQRCVRRFIKVVSRYCNICPLFRDLWLVEFFSFQYQLQTQFCVCTVVFFRCRRTPPPSTLTFHVKRNQPRSAWASLCPSLLPTVLAVVLSQTPSCLHCHPLSLSGMLFACTLHTGALSPGPSWGHLLREVFSDHSTQSRTPHSIFYVLPQVHLSYSEITVSFLPCFLGSKSVEAGTLSSSLQRPENLSYGWFWNICEWIARKWQSRTPTHVYLTSDAKGCALPKCRELLVFPTELESSAVPQKHSTSTLVQHSLGRAKVTKDQTALVHPSDFI